MKNKIKIAGQRLHFLLILLIIFVGLFSYFNSLPNNFVWDDNQLIVQNQYIRSFKYLGQIFSSDLFSFGYRQDNFYRPLQTLSYAVDYQIWKLNPFGYHLTNVILHILVGVLIFYLIRLLFDSKLMAFLTSLIFVAHPIHTEAVSYISGRADILAAVFFLLSLLTFITYINRQGRVYLYIISLALYALSLLSKESAIVFALLYLFYALLMTEAKVKRKLILLGAPFFVIDFLYILLRLTLLNFAKTSIFATPASLFERVCLIPRAILDYIRLLIFPANLHMERALTPFLSAETIFSIIAIGLAGYFVVSAYKNKAYRSRANYFIGWFFVMLLPVLNIIPINAVIAEHWLYLPSLSIFLLASFTLSQLKIKRISVYLICAVIVIGYMVTTIKYNRFWHDNFTLYEHILSLSPNSARVHNNLGEEYDSAGRYAKAIAEYEEAVRINPAYAIAHNNLGVTLDKIGKSREAVRHFEAAVDINSNFAEAYNNLSTACRRMGLLDEAIMQGKKSTEIKPNYAEAYNNLGMAYYQKGDLEAAGDNYKKAIRLNPNLAEAYNNLGVVCIKKGLVKDARRCWEKALEINPKYKSPLDNLELLRKISG